MAEVKLLDFEEIRRKIERLAREDAGWRVFFAAHGIAPIQVAY